MAKQIVSTEKTIIDGFQYEIITYEICREVKRFIFFKKTICNLFYEFKFLKIVCPRKKISMEC